MDSNLEANTAAETVVGPSVKIQGDLNSEGNIRIEGQVTGKIKTSQSVHVGEGAKIAADVTAGNVVVAGEVLGNMKISGSLIMQATARITGDISCAVLHVEDGAQYTGKCSMAGTAPAASTSTGKANKKQELEPEPEE